MSDPLHELDQKVFDEYPSEIMETLMKLHPGHCNHTLPFYGPMLYFIIRAIGARSVIEIGMAQLYSTWFMAQAIKDNNARFQMKGKYVGVDIHDKSELLKPLIDKGLPIEHICIDAADLTVDMLGGEGSVDLLFQDGFHNTEQCLKELDIIYPALKDFGRGYLVMHDVYSYCIKYFQIVRDDPKWNFEYVRFMSNYGLSICRKMDNYEKKDEMEYWPTGDMPESQRGIQ